MNESVMWVWAQFDASGRVAGGAFKISLLLAVANKPSIRVAIRCIDSGMHVLKPCHEAYTNSCSRL
jgi:hypothetical protein